MIDKLLNNYKRNKATIEMLKIKINQWEIDLTKDALELDELYSKPKVEKLGIQKTGVSNPTEKLVIRSEDLKVKINFWITDAKNKIEKLESDNQMVKILLDSLDEESYFIITQKHFENKKWNIITHQFNSKYRNEYHEYITSSGIRKKYDGIKRKLLEILDEILPKS